MYFEIKRFRNLLLKNKRLLYNYYCKSSPTLSLNIDDLNQRLIVYEFFKLLGLPIDDLPKENALNMFLIDIRLEKKMPWIVFTLWHPIISNCGRQHNSISFLEFFVLMGDDKKLYDLFQEAQIKVMNNKEEILDDIQKEDPFIYLKWKQYRHIEIIHYPFAGNDFKALIEYANNEDNKSIFIFSDENSESIKNILNGNIKKCTLFSDEEYEIEATKIKMMKSTNLDYYVSLFEPKDVNYGDSFTANISIKRNGKVIYKTELLYIISQYEPLVEYFLNPMNIKIAHTIKNK